MWLDEMMKRSLQKRLAYGRGRAPAAAFALWIAVGQLCAWWLERNECLALMSLCVLILVATRAGYRGFLAGFLVGLLSCYSHLTSQYAAMPQGIDDARALVRVEDSGRRGEPGRVAFLARDVLRESQPLLRLSAVELPWRNASGVEQGDLIWIRGEASTVNRPVNPWSWDAYLWRQGVAEEFKVSYLSQPVERAGPEPLALAREWLRRRTAEILGDRRGGALFLSMALGYRDVLSKHLEDALAELGLSHLLVVSGYQVTMVFGAACAPLACLMALLPGLCWARQGVAGLALLVTAAYVAFIGSEASAVRALVAAALVSAELLLESGRRFSQRWGVALLAVQLVWPWAALEIGVQLTFAALAGIGLGSRLGRNSAVKTFLWVQISVWVLTGLIVAVWSGKVAWLSMLLNLVIAPFWSAWNCVVGLAAFFLAVLGVPGGACLFECVAWVNEGLASISIVARDALGHSPPLSPAGRGVAVLLYGLTAAVLVSVAERRGRHGELISMAR